MSRVKSSRKDVIRRDFRLLPSSAGHGRYCPVRRAQTLHQPRAPAAPRRAIKSRSSGQSRCWRLAVPSPFRMSPFSVVVWMPLARRRRVVSVVSPVRASVPFVQNGAVSLSALYPRSRLSDRRGCSAACPSQARSIRPYGPPVLGTRPRRPAVRRVRLERPARSTKEKTHD